MPVNSIKPDRAANNDSAERRKHKRVNILATFCVFVTNAGETPDVETTPFISAGLYDIGLGGAQFLTESLIACSPFSDLEHKIKEGSTIWLVPNPVNDGNSCSCGSVCLSQGPDGDKKIETLGFDPTEATVMWVSGNRFGCIFVNPAKGFTTALEKIIDDILDESGIKF